MPPKKRLLLEILDDGPEGESSLQHNIRRRQRRGRPSRLTAPLQPLGDDDDSEGIDPADLPEFIPVDLEEIQKDFQCAICLGILKKTCAFMKCMHRFCTKCIEKSMRMGKKECPTCRVPCASRRDLRDNPNYDKLVSIFFPDIEKYEELDLSISEEARTINMQVQASIAQIQKSQSEAVKRCEGDKSEQRRGTEGISWGGAHARSKNRRPKQYSVRNFDLNN